MNNLVSIVITTYNNKAKVKDVIISSVEQSYTNIKVIVVDDGSTDGAQEHLKSLSDIYPSLELILKEHGERGLAREAGINMAKEFNSDFILFIDDDMILDLNLIDKCLNYFIKNDKLGALVIPERPYSAYKNFYSKVKVFERSIINNAGKKVGRNSIEAARFWSMGAYLISGGLNPKEISFEETQPTIRYMEQNGIILRAVDTYLKHDEKMSTLKNIISKKYYYFNKMNHTFESEDRGFFKALTRWYFFRPVMYRGGNILKALRHPLLTIGMIFMYICLSITGVLALTRKTGK